MISAKVYCSKVERPEGAEYASVTFYADYADGRNASWAYATPALSVGMTVRADVAEHFVAGGRYTLLFEPEPAPEAAAA